MFCLLVCFVYMKFVVARECCRSVSSQSGRHLQLELKASFIFLKNFQAFFTLHVSLGSEGF